MHESRNRERAGNCALEEVVMVMKVRHDLMPYYTVVNTEELFPATRC